MKESRKRAEEEVLVHENKLKEAYLDLNRVQKALKKAKDEGVLTNDVEIMDKREPVRDSDIAQNNSELNISNVLSAEEFAKLWETSHQKAQVRPILLSKVIIIS